MISKLTIAIPTFNRNSYLLKLLKTIPENFPGQVVISDNGCYISKEIKDSYPNYKVIDSVEVVKMFANWNIAVSHVQTEWFIIPSDDDVFFANTFEILQAALEKYADADIIIFGHAVIDENDKVLSKWKPEKQSINEAPYGFLPFSLGVEARLPSIVFRTEFVKKMGLFNELLDVTAADSLLIQKCLIFGKSVYDPTILSGYRTWPNNFTNQLAASKVWLEKIDMWQSEIANDLANSNLSYLNTKKIKDEVYCLNLLSGVLVMKKNKESFLKKINFVFQNRIPWSANWQTKLRVIKQLLTS